MEYLGAFLVVGIFAAIVCIWGMKTNKLSKELINNLTEEQIVELQRNEVQDFDSKKISWTQKAIIAKAIDKDKKVNLKLIWFNTIIQNRSYNNCDLAEISMKKSDFETRNLKEGDYVRISMDFKNFKFKVL